jgi:FKBP-type peptidyl-prolyl cis-trans isomerase
LANGYQIVAGDEVSFWYTAITLNGEIVFDTNVKSVAVSFKLDTTVRNFQPIIAQAGYTNLIEGLKIGLLLSRGKEKTKILFPSNYGFGDNNIGPVPAWSPLLYEIEIISVSNPSIVKEELEIQNYLISNIGVFTPDPLGFWYGITVNGQGLENPTVTSKIYAWYQTKTLSGNVLSELVTPNELIDLNDETIPLGLRLGYTKLKIGDSAIFLVPSPLGFGTKEVNGIMPYTPLIFEVRLDSLKN